MTDDGDMHHHTENEPSRLTENGLIARAKTRLNQTGVAVVISYAVDFRGEGLLAHVVVSKYVEAYEIATMALQRDPATSKLIEGRRSGQRNDGSTRFALEPA